MSRPDNDTCSRSSRDGCGAESQGQPRCDGHATLAGCAAGLDLFGDSRQRQQEVVVVGGLLPLDRLPPAAANKKTPAEREHVLAGVRLMAAAGCNASREGTVSGFDGVIAVVDANNDTHLITSLPYYI